MAEASNYLMSAASEEGSSTDEKSSVEGFRNDCDCTKGIRRSEKKTGSITSVRCYNRAFVTFNFDAGLIMGLVKDIRHNHLSESSNNLKNTIRHLLHDNYQNAWVEFVNEFYSTLRSKCSGPMEQQLGIAIDGILKFFEDRDENSRHRYVLLAYLLYVFDIQLFKTVLQLRETRGPRRSGKRSKTPTTPIFPFPLRKGTSSERLYRDTVVCLTLLEVLCVPIIFTMTAAVPSSVTPFVYRMPSIDSHVLCHIATRVPPPWKLTLGTFMHEVLPLFRFQVIELIRIAAFPHDTVLVVSLKYRRPFCLKVWELLQSSKVDPAVVFVKIKHNDLYVRSFEPEENIDETKFTLQCLQTSAFFKATGIPETSPPNQDGMYTFTNLPPGYILDEERVKLVEPTMMEFHVANGGSRRLSDYETGKIPRTTGMFDFPNMAMDMMYPLNKRKKAGRKPKPKNQPDARIPKKQGESEAEIEDDGNDEDENNEEDENNDKDGNNDKDANNDEESGKKRKRYTECGVGSPKTKKIRADEAPETSSCIASPHDSRLRPLRAILLDQLSHRNVQAPHLLLQFQSAPKM